MKGPSMASLPFQAPVDRGAPFRPRPWPLSSLRIGLHRLRLAWVRRTMAGDLVCGEHVAIARNADIRAPHHCRIGSYVSFGKNFTCETDLEIGDHVLVSSNVAIVGNDHPFDDPGRTVYAQPRRDDSAVRVGSDVLIGFGTIIVGPVAIGDGCIVGAGAVVVRDLPPYTICVGNPARPVRRRFADIGSVD